MCNFYLIIPIHHIELCYYFCLPLVRRRQHLLRILFCHKDCVNHCTQLTLTVFSGTLRPRLLHLFYIQGGRLWCLDENSNDYIFISTKTTGTGLTGPETTCLPGMHSLASQNRLFLPLPNNLTLFLRSHNGIRGHLNGKQRRAV